MAKRIPHLSTKDGRHYFRMRVPLDLVQHVGKAEVSQALGDVNKAQAEVAVRELSSQWSAHFLDERHRLGLVVSPPAASMRAALPRREATPEEVALVAQVSAQRLLALDEEVRIDGTHTEGADAWLSSVSTLGEAVSDMLASGQLGATKALLQADLDVHALTLPDDRIEARRMVRTWAAAQARAIKGIEARGRGVPVATPAPVALPESLQHPDAALIAPNKKTAGQLKLRDVMDLWAADERTRPPKTLQKAAQAVAHFERLTGNPPLGLLTKAIGSEFRTALLASDMSDKTASDRLSWIQILLNFEASRYGRIAANPWKGLTVKVKKSTTRGEWKDADASKLFALPLFQRYELPVNKNAGADAAYWLPIIGAFTGARITEIAQLLVAARRQLS